MAPSPHISVVVPSHERPLRLRWLLNALEEQTLERSRWEVVVVHDSRGEETNTLLNAHPLADAGVLRHRRLEAGTGTPPRQRNVGWRIAQAPLIAFTDDDCRPEPDWLEVLLAAGQAHRGAIVQGATRPDVYEIELLRAPHARTLEVDPPGPFAQTCNILYPRQVLEAVGGFDERFATSGEDTDLALRAREAGVAYIGEARAVINHAVVSYSLPAFLRMTWKWRDLPFLVKRHARVRETYTLGLFWRPTHAWLLLASVGLFLSRRTPAAVVLMVPYAREIGLRRGRHLRGRLMAAVEAPGRVLIDAVEIAALATGSARARTFFL